MIETCEGCELPIPDGEDGRVWCATDLGMRALVVHRSQDCGRLALERRGGKMLRGNRPPLSAAERHREALVS